MGKVINYIISHLSSDSKACRIDRYSQLTITKVDFRLHRDLSNSFSGATSLVKVFVHRESFLTSKLTVGIKNPSFIYDADI